MRETGPGLNRRDFIKGAALSSAAVLSPVSGASNAAKLPRRTYRPGVELSVIGVGTLALRAGDQEQANRMVARAVEEGVNFFDCAPAYGKSQDVVGPALKPYRKDCFLACKTMFRDAERAKEDFKKSLELLKTDYFDLYQMHCLRTIEKDVDPAFAKGGIMDFLMEAKKAGQIRHIGFSTHSIEPALAIMDRYDFDSILFPVNFASFTKGQFGPELMAKAKAKGVARLAMKMLCRQEWPSKDYRAKSKYSRVWYEPVDDPHEVDLATRFTLGQEVTASIPPAVEELHWAAIDAARRFKPLTEAEKTELAALAQSVTPVFRVGKST